LVGAAALGEDGTRVGDDGLGDVGELVGDH
jgi:hypothetical protein